MTTGNVFEHGAPSIPPHSPYFKLENMMIAHDQWIWGVSFISRPSGVFGKNFAQRDWSLDLRGRDGTMFRGVWTVEHAPSFTASQLVLGSPGFWPLPKRTMVNFWLVHRKTHDWLIGWWFCNVQRDLYGLILHPNDQWIAEQIAKAEVKTRDVFL